MLTVRYSSANPTRADCAESRPTQIVAKASLKQELKSILMDAPPIASTSSAPAAAPAAFAAAVVVAPPLPAANGGTAPEQPVRRRGYRACVACRSVRFLSGSGEAGEG